MKKYIHTHMASLAILLISCVSSKWADILQKDPILHLPIIVSALCFAIITHVIELYNENSQLLQQVNQTQNKADSLNEKITNKNTEIEDLKRKIQTNDIVAVARIAENVEFIKGTILETSSISLSQSVPDNVHAHPSVRQNSD